MVGTGMVPAFLFRDRTAGKPVVENKKGRRWGRPKVSMMSPTVGV
ncbi:hypothetical protein [Shinella curvata]|nr:hypothetical protein [Shinella curvata]